MQSWVDSGGKNLAKAPFLITPPLFRLDAKEDNVLRVVRTGGNLPEDKESLYWLNIKAIPSSKQVAGVNTLQIAIKTRIKLIYRPAGLKSQQPQELSHQLTWRRNGNQLQVTNPTSYVINFNDINVGGKKLEEASWVAPGAVAAFSLPPGISGNQIQFSVINDYGSPGIRHQASF